MEAPINYNVCPAHKHVYLFNDHFCKLKKDNELTCPVPDGEICNLLDRAGQLTTAQVVKFAGHILIQQAQLELIEAQRKQIEAAIVPEQSR
jgi:hypothetical protein